MSRVFVATEVDLDRQVVVKVLPSELSAGVNSDRFRREIQLAARLQHPHIVPLLAAGARGSLLYYTMPFIAGENLRARLARSGELPLQDATRILREVADALSYAHSNGVVHRDIKPENILISGHHALVTDFGVSKALSSATDEASTSELTLTSVGMALGTPAYMAPEQAAADPKVDQRADIYALGVVGYELIGGQPPFTGLNPQQTLAAHVTTLPVSVSQHRPQMAPGLASVIMKCLEKRPSDRWQSAEQLYDALEPYAVSSGATAAFDPAKRSTSFSWTPQRIAVAAGVVGVVSTALIASTVAARRGAESLVVANTRQITSSPGIEMHPSISPDGRMVAYIARTSGRQRLFVRQLSGGRAIALTDSGVGAQWPRWSSDGSTILYKSEGKFWLAPSLGGSPVPVSGLDSLYECASSHAGDRFVCVHDFDGRLAVVKVTDGERQYLTGAGASNWVSSPAWSADDNLIAFSTGNPGFISGGEMGNIGSSSLWVIGSDGGTPARITDDTHLNVSPIWTPDGSLLFISSLGGARDVYLQRLTAGMRARGPPVRLTTGLNPHTISLSENGITLAYSVLTTAANIWTGTTQGSAAANVMRAKPVTTGNQTIESGAVSPDGKWLAYDSNLNGNQDIYKVLIAGGEPQRLTSNTFDDFSPQWSPDGNEIAFHSLPNGDRDIFLMDANGANLRGIVVMPGEQRGPRWVGSDVIVYRSEPDSTFRIRREGNRWNRPELLSDRNFGRHSPDGKLIARFLGEAQCSGCQRGLYVMDADGLNPRPVAVPAVGRVMLGGATLKWSSDARNLYTQMGEPDGSASLWQLAVNGDAPRRLFHFADSTRRIFRGLFDVHGDNFYFTIGDRQSDIWVMELKKQ